ncbi:MULTISPECIES: hypothetical protein [Muribaculaceae]|jgi:hypothetical protein|uniref:hypothetical protein n=2 Tax=Bacteroidales TaxID=171549 RepID=UPI0023A8C991|nr:MULTISPECIES: hypothetical protein [Muribaculaceae]
MARTVEEIKKDMTAEFMKMEAVKSRYGLDGSKSFADCFSMASLENIIFYVFAVAVWALEKLFDLHRADVDARIEQLEPHTLRWYVSKAKAYMQGQKLVTDCDYYDTEGMTEQDIAAAKVVKYAVATESNTVVYIKVAREVDGNPAALTAGQLEGLTSYMNEIKDAGVSVQLRNEPADQMRISLLIYYDPTLLIIDANGNGSQNGKDPVRETTKQVIENLPFNGMFRKSDLMAALQALPCVEVADIKSVKVKPRNGAEWQTVEGYDRPFSGYYSIDALTVDYQPYNAIE